jgi:Kef-type K+ transport system membrane component KefB
MPEEVQYLLVVVGLFLVPGVLQRFRIPGPITCVALGLALGTGFGLFHNDTTLPMLGTLGIVTLFLFAGLDVDFSELRQGARVTAGYLVIYVALLGGTALVAARLFDLEWRPAVLFSLALFTPSASFIIDSLNRQGAPAELKFWVRTKAIGAELVSLTVLFVVVQSGTVQSLGVATATFIAMVLVLPYVFRGFVQVVLPFAPKSEFAFLVILALICAYVTRHLGVYYLVGAFVVGVTAVRLRQKLPALASERLLVGIELFASFFIPLYFFKVGLHLDKSLFTPMSLLLGLAFLVVLVPLRIAVASGYRRVVLKEPLKEATKFGIKLVPTLVFTVVISGILREQFALADHLYGALVFYALASTAVPSVLAGKPAPSASPAIEDKAVSTSPGDLPVVAPAPAPAAEAAPASEHA